MIMTIDEFIRLKMKHGRLAAFTLGEGEEWREWKHEFGYPANFHALKFKDDRVWDKINGMRPIDA